MKRLTFKPQHVDPVLAGTKRFTSRWRDQRLVVGDVVAAVTSNGKKPAFLTPASEAFAHLRITSVDAKFWKDFTDHDAADCGVTREWYTAGRTPSDMDRIYKYGFEVVTK